MKKLLSIILSIAMLFTISTAVFAEEITSSTPDNVLTFDELTKISTKEIKKISIGCSKCGLGLSEFSISSPTIISNIVNSIKDMQFVEDTRGSAGGWLYGINFYMEDETYIQFGTRLYIDKINYIALEHDTAIEIMKNYHDLIESIDSSEWATDNILECMELGFLEDVSELKYKEPITREKFCELAFNLILVANQGFHIENTEVKFTDTDNYKIQDLNRAGIIYGKSETEFAPDDYLTREEAATILYRVAEFLEVDMPQSAYDESIPYYTDKEAISDWAFNAVFVMKEMGIMVGTSEAEFSPKATYTAEQAIATLIRIYEKTRKTYTYETPLGVIQTDKNYNSHINFAIQCNAKVQLIQNRTNQDETQYTIEKPVKALTDQTSNMLISVDDFAEIFGGEWKLNNDGFEFTYDTSYEVELVKSDDFSDGTGGEWPNKTETINVITFYPDMNTVRINGTDVEIKAQYGGKIYNSSITMYNDVLYIPVQMVAELLGYDIAWLQVIL